MKKKIAALMSIAILATGTLTVYANDNILSPKAVSCGVCRDGKLFDENMVFERMNVWWNCKHYPNGFDVEYELRHMTRIACNNKNTCGMATSWDYTHSTYEIRCQGGY